ncbi:hypothetical protein BH09BAC2_BH09BAC2_21290 [soil metagenome]
MNTSLTTAFNHSNKSILWFLTKLVLFVLTWEALYYFFLKGARIPDKQLTEFLSFSIVKVLNFFTAGSGYKVLELEYGAYILNGAKQVIFIADSCNNLSMLVIYLSVILFLPFSAMRKIIFSVAGFLVLMVANVIRCIALITVYQQYNSWFDFNHKFLFSMLMMLLIFYGWMLYIKPRKHATA